VAFVEIRNLITKHPKNMKIDHLETRKITAIKANTSTQKVAPERKILTEEQTPVLHTLAFLCGRLGSGLGVFVLHLGITVVAAA
jgi:hypothetical protein